MVAINFAKIFGVSDSQEDFDKIISRPVSRGLSSSEKKVYALMANSWISLQRAPESLFFLNGKKILQVSGGLLSGLLMATVTQIASLSTFIHEAVGHCLLGFRSTYLYARGAGPGYVVCSWEAFKEGGFNGWLHWLFNNDGIAGLAWRKSREVNALGEYLGVEKREAWISLSGSIPGFFINAAAVSTGMVVREKIPVLGYGLVALGLTQHAANSVYPWSAAMMSSETLATKVGSGHDFANFAARVSRLTSLSPKTVAITTATVWTSSIPLLAFSIYLFQKSRDRNLVSDREALQHWILQSSIDDKKAERLKELYEKYRRGSAPFYNVLLKELSKDEIKKSKEEILSQWAHLYPQDKVQTVLNTVSVISGAVATVISLSSKVFEILGQTTVPVLAPIARGSAHLSPILGTVSLLSEVYEVHKDLKISSELVPKAAKVLSVAKLVVAVAGSTLLIVGSFIPGINLFIICGIALGTGGTIVFALCKNIVVQRRFKLYQSIQPARCDLMLEFARRHRKSKDAGIRKEVTQWVKNIRAANRVGLLKDSGLRKKLQRLLD